MSGLQHHINAAQYYDDEAKQNKDVTWPALTSADKDIANMAIEYAGYHKGFKDGVNLAAGRRRGWPPAMPVWPKYIKLHLEHAIREMVEHITGAEVEVSRVRTIWLNGYRSGLYDAQVSVSTGYMMSPEGDPDQQ